MASPAASRTVPPIRRLQILTISIVGALAVLTFLLALLLTGGIAEMLRNIAFGLGIACAVIGASFAIVGNR